MDASLTALMVSVVGVVGTLGGTVLTQTRADRLKRLELEHAGNQRAEDLRRADLLREIEKVETREREASALRRQCYITLNTAGRQYMTALVNHLHALRRGDVSATSEALEIHRAAFRDNYAEAQMIVPTTVLESSSRASRRLNTLFGQLKGIEASPAGKSQELEVIEHGLDEVWVCLRQLRAEMRKDLGIDQDELGTA
ncbi:MULTISPECIES: hypothetical protein [Kitasatospora]|uniref:hypothetical protein n=1 Tax=Kitasatospora TaxID=2063 RepID=UPI0006867AD6|nr:MULTISPECIES: hypothetical protein [Kitasatospora]